MGHFDAMFGPQSDRSGARLSWRDMKFVMSVGRMLGDRANRIHLVFDSYESWEQPVG